MLIHRLLLDQGPSDTHIEPMGEDQNQSAADEQNSIVARLLPIALPTGIATLGFGAYLMTVALPAAIALLVIGTLLTWLGKRATHHTLSQPLGCLFLLVGVALLVVNQIWGPSILLVQILLPLLLAGVILGPRKTGF